MGDPRFVDSHEDIEITSAGFDSQFQAYRVVHKATMIIHGLALSLDQLSWMLDPIRNVSWFDLNTLPTTGANTAADFNAWTSFVRLAKARVYFPQGETAVGGLISLAYAADPGDPSTSIDDAKQAWIVAVSNHTGWSVEDLEVLLGTKNDHSLTGRLNVQFPQDYRDGTLLERLHKAFSLLRKLGMTAAQADGLATGAVSPAHARVVRQAVRSRYDEEQWLTLAKSLRDSLRARQRAALVSYLTGNRILPVTVRNSNDLHAHFLLDVEMDPCTVTSRIKQAISSVQLFVQRCFMNLEPDVLADTEQNDRWHEWQWMKNYRVWEANRKIFLYPENWIEPELRDDKSPFFRELESELLQSDLTHEVAEQALRNYLEKLDQVARLEVVACHHQIEKDSDGNTSLDHFHVFARTQATPHVYFYRKRVDGAYWTAWEKVGLDIEGDHLLALVWNRRLMLFWPSFGMSTSPASPKLDDDGNLSGTNPDKRLQIKMCWSEYKENKWQPKRVSTQSVTGYHFGLDGKDNYFFRSQLRDPNQLRLIVVYLNDKFDEQSGRRASCFEFPNALCDPYISYCHYHNDNQVSSSSLTEWVENTFPFRMYRKESDNPDDSQGWPLSLPKRAHSVGSSVRVLPSKGGIFRILREGVKDFAQQPFFYLDEEKTFYVQPVKDPMAESVLANSSLRLQVKYQFITFHYPHTDTFLYELDRSGIDGLMQRQLQLNPFEFAPLKPNGQRVSELHFFDEYGPNKVSDHRVMEPYPSEEMGFKGDSTYALYNWELFFHIPLLIADRLTKNQRYEDAQRWLHYIFDPTDSSNLDAPQRYWRTKPLFEKEQPDYQRERIEYILRLLVVGGDAVARAGLGAVQQDDLRDFENAVVAWRKSPFKPHLIARMRNTAYQKTVVMKYLDNIIAWADQLFRRDSIESNNQATQLYILAAELLGRRPEAVTARTMPRVQTYESLAPKLGTFSNAMVQIENLVFLPHDRTFNSIGEKPASLPSTGLISTLYFCIPKNDKLLSYWDTVADRLFKLRHCMNIEGVVRQLPLFEPPIDPAMLVKAAAAGVDLGSVLNDVNVSVPYYRFNILSQKASEICGELKSLGQALLSSLEKQDTERLSLLRSEHETALLALVEDVRKLQLDESEQNKEALLKSRDSAVERYLHYQKLLGVQSPQVPGIGETIPQVQPSRHVVIQSDGGIQKIPHEQRELDQLALSNDMQLSAADYELLANYAHLIPNIKSAPMGVGVEAGGIGFASNAFANMNRTNSADSAYRANRSAKLGQYAMRAHEWLLQNNLAAREIMQIDQQYLAAELRSQIAEKELSNHLRQLENARQVEETLRSKYTNQELYGWFLGQLSNLYFRTYQLVYDLAKRAEGAFRHELGIKDTNYIRFGYWDSLKKGLLAGERLYHDIKRMEVAYLDQHKRDYEITTEVAISQIDPLALVQLRLTGSCEVSLPESLFDLDYAGHIMRRLKSVAITIPAVTGPHTGVNCTLTLLGSSVRHGNTLISGQYTRQEGDNRFTDYRGTIQSIVTSRGQYDNGLFENNLRDERYLPFEGAGVISRWRIELPSDFRRFDYDSISDVILQLRYTARDGGSLLQRQAALELRATLNSQTRSEGQQGLARVFSLQHEFPTQWHHFLNRPPVAPVTHSVTLDLSQRRFPFFVKNKSLSINKVEILVKVKSGFENNHNETTLAFALAAGAAAPTTTSLAAWQGLLRGEWIINSGATGDWTLNGWITPNGAQPIDSDALEDIHLLCHYSVM